MRSLLAAISFLTVLPMRRSWALTGWAPFFFPWVGILVAAVPAALGVYVAGYLPRGPIAVLQLVAWIGITGALHLDGLVDVADALGATTPDERLRLLKDSRVGTYGLVAGTLALLARWQLLASFSHPVPILLAACLSRGGAGVYLGVFPSAHVGLSTAFGKSAIRSLLTAVATLSLGVILGGLLGAVVAVLALVVFGIVLAAESRLLGGVTGDCYGAAIELTELAVLFVAGVAWTTAFPWAF